MRFDRQRYLDYVSGKDTSRPMFVELFGLLVGLDQEWLEQGATPEELDLSDFELDYLQRIDCGGHTGLFGGKPPIVLEDNEHFRISTDALGRTMRLEKRTATIPLPLNYPVQSMDDWVRLKPLYVYRPQRINEEAVAQAALQRSKQGALVQGSIPGGFDTLRELMGEELACMAYYDQPELVHDIMNTLCDTAMRTLEPIAQRVTIDRLSVHEDFAGRSGPLVGPDQIDTYIRPYYRMVYDMLKSYGTTLFGIDSDGNINPVIEALGRAGLNELFPMEPAAGMDIVKTRKQYGMQFVLRGGIDKFVIRNGNKEDIRRELEYKMQPMMRQSGTVFGLDHRIPNGTPLTNYRYYVDTAREILGIPPRKHNADDRKWFRTA
ncbi:MAG: hypothetical protein HC898_07410 [Phycisphaerales bacterium]|nr:hypothetical protein [Phycisphaerales bacterium]